MAKVKPEAAETPRVRQRGGSELVEGVLPELGGSPVGAVPPPKGDHPPFFIAVHPDRWKVQCGKVIPNIRRLRLTPGANAVDRDPQTRRPLAGLALAQAQEHGWKVLMWDEYDYLRKIKDLPNGWTDKWTTVYPGSGETSYDEEGFATWIRGLVDAGKIPGPPAYVLERMREGVQKQIERYVDRNKSEYAGKIRQLKANLAAIEAELGTVPKTPSSVSADARPDVGL